MNETLKRRLASLESERDDRELIEADKAYYDSILGDGLELSPRQLAFVSPALRGCLPY